ncbi:MAG: LuxR C-terminal-related transcriptional regulator [Nitrospiraceae bacterium]
MGQIIKQIAHAEGITGRTVRMHLQHIKRKLYTDDLVNAVVIAVKNGMLLHSSPKIDERRELPTNPPGRTT